jgi:hypothetical protein
LLTFERSDLSDQVLALGKIRSVAAAGGGFVDGFRQIVAGKFILGHGASCLVEPRAWSTLTKD